MRDEELHLHTRSRLVLPRVDIGQATLLVRLRRRSWLPSTADVLFAFDYGTLLHCTGRLPMISRPFTALFFACLTACAGEVATRVVDDASADISDADVEEIEDNGLRRCNETGNCYGGTCQKGYCCDGTYSSGVCTCNGGPGCDLEHVCCHDDTDAAGVIKGCQPLGRLYPCGF